MWRNPPHASLPEPTDGPWACQETSHRHREAVAQPGAPVPWHPGKACDLRYRTDKRRQCLLLSRPPRNAPRVEPIAPISYRDFYQATYAYTHTRIVSLPSSQRRWVTGLRNVVRHTQHAARNRVTSRQFSKGVSHGKRWIQGPRL